MQHFLTRGVELVDAVAHHQEIFGIGFAGHRFEYGVLEIGHVGEVERAIETHRNQMLAGGHVRMNLDVA